MIYTGHYLMITYNIINYETYNIILFSINAKYQYV
jgi:hypothetical protein